MLKGIVKVESKNGRNLVFSREGMLLELDDDEFGVFQKYGGKKEICEKHKKFLSQLVGYGILEFKNFQGEEIEKEYDLSLFNHNSSAPIYPAPVLAHLALTDKCNMKCKYCSVRNLHTRAGCLNELSTDEWKKIIYKLAEWGVFQIGFTGGEPTLRNDLVELVRYVHEKGCVVNLTTNGWFLDKKLVDALVETGMKQCQVSLDSHVPEIHDELRGKGSWERAVKSIRLMLGKGVAVGIDCVVSANNLESVPEFIEWIKSEGIPYLTLIKLKKGDLDIGDYGELKPDYVRHSEIIREICLRRVNAEPNITLDCGSVSNLQSVASKSELFGLPIAGCPLGHHLICSAPNGDIYPCASLLEKKFCLGNLLRDDLKKLWVENKMLKDFRLVKNKVRGKCKSCDRLDLCRGGCRGIVNAVSDLWDSDPDCSYIEMKGGVKK